MRILRSFALGLALAACSTTEADNPRVEITAGGFMLHLPPAMQQSLAAAAPGFRSVRSVAFRADVGQAAAEGGSIQALFAVVGDFDGDGTMDAALEGSTPGDTALVVFAILNKGSKPTAVEVARFPTYDADAVGPPLRWRPRRASIVPSSSH